jgi:hypothetical protein
MYQRAVVTSLQAGEPSSPEVMPNPSSLAKPLAKRATSRAARARVAPASPQDSRLAGMGESVPWQQRIYVTIPLGAELLCCSRAQIYNLGEQDIVELFHIEQTGRTVVSVSTLRRVLDSAVPFRPGASAPRGAALSRVRAAIRAAASSRD